MSKNDLLSSYFYNQNGELDEFLIYHPICLVKCGYMIMKNRVKIDFNPYDLFLEDITFRLTELSNDILCFRHIEYEPQYPTGLFDFKSYHATGNKAVIALQEKLINEGHIIINQIDMSKISFSILQNSLNEEWGHLFLTVWLDDQFLYYVDEPRLLSKNHQLYPMNKEVGVIEREKMGDLSSEQNWFGTVTVNEDALSKLPINTLTLKNVIENFYAKEFIHNGKVNYYGKCAYEKIIAICDQNPLCLLNTMTRQVLDIDFLRIPMGRRKVLKKWLSTYANNDDIMNTIDTSLGCWEKIRIFLLAKKYRKENYFDQDCKKLFEELLDIEELLIEQLRKLLTQLSQVDNRG